MSVLHTIPIASMYLCLIIYCAHIVVGMDILRRTVNPEKGMKKASSNMIKRKNPLTGNLIKNIRDQVPIVRPDSLDCLVGLRDH